MKLIKPDYEGRVEIPGVPHAVARPVNIDKSQTGFDHLRSLRIYRFEAGSVVDGHAEEDEVLIVVVAGTIGLTLIDNDAGDNARLFTLTAASDSGDYPCAAYLPPQAGYRLVPRTDAEVAYARATPAVGPPPAVFNSHAGNDHAGITVLLEEATYPRLLRVRLLQVTAGEQEIAFEPIREATAEALIHFRIDPEEGGATIAGTIPVSTGDTVAVMPGERPTLRVAKGSSALVLIVLAGC